MLLGQDPRRERLGVVAGQHRDADLRQDRPGVEVAR